MRSFGAARSASARLPRRRREHPVSRLTRRLEPEAVAHDHGGVGVDPHAGAARSPGKLRCPLDRLALGAVHPAGLAGLLQTGGADPRLPGAHRDARDYARPSAGLAVSGHREPGLDGRDRPRAQVRALEDRDEQATVGLAGRAPERPDPLLRQLALAAPDKAHRLLGQVRVGKPPLDREDRHLPHLPPVALQVGARVPKLAYRLVDRAFEAERRPDPRQELALVHGLREEVVGAGLNARHAILDRVQRRHQHDRDQPGLRIALKNPEGADPVHAGHHHVEQDEVGWRRGHPLERLEPVRRGLRGKPATLELLLEVVDVEGLVVDDQDAGLSIRLRIGLPSHRVPRCRLTSSTSRSSSIGFATKSSQPASIASSTSAEQKRSQPRSTVSTLVTTYRG